MREYELNIGLFVGNDDAIDWLHANTYGEIKRREEELRSYLAGQLSCHMRLHCGEEPTLVCKGWISTDDPGGFHQWLYQLAEKFDQDCIAVYYPETGGYLLGPNSAAWGDFHEEYFERY